MVIATRQLYRIKNYGKMFEKCEEICIDYDYQFVPDE